MKKLEEKFRRIVYPFIGSSFLTGDESEETIKMNVNSCIEITTDVAVKFGEFCRNLPKDNKDILRVNPDITTNELFQIFIKDYYEK